MTETPLTGPGPRLQLHGRRRFSIAVVYAYGLLMMLPVAAAMAATTLLKVGLLPALLPLVVTLATALFLPVGFGNPYISRLVRSQLPNRGAGLSGFVVQLTLEPRAATGWRALMEDADDVGFLQIEPNSLRFRGDGLDLEIPWPSVTRVELQNIGLRGLFLYERVRLEVGNGPGFTGVNLAERSSWFTTTARRLTRDLYRQVRGRCQA